MPTPLELLRRSMAERGIDALYIPTADYHDSEYAGAHFALRHHLSGFDGSAGTLVVFSDWAGLWTDGRYFLQAERQLSGSGITLMRQGLVGTQTMEQALTARLGDGQTLAFDGRCVSAKTAARFLELLSPKGASLRSDWDLPEEVWPARPPLSAAPVWALSSEYAGLSREEKLGNLRAAVRAAGAKALLLTALDEIAWLLNLRGDDVACTPVFLAYFLLEAERATLFVNDTILSPAILALLEEAKVTVAPYNAVYAAAAALPAVRVLLDRGRVNYRLVQALSGAILDRRSPVALQKAVKNETEIANIRAAHLKDGAAMTKFMYRLKTKGLPETELAVSSELEALRREQPQYLGPSFPPIVGYGANAAIVHYSATAEMNAALRPEGFLLVDSGGHYLAGTTDCTRTFALGPLTDEQKQHYTAVLQGHLALAATRFPKGCTGHQLDSIARRPLWQLGLDYKHGTGHGVGYLMGVHEGPQSIRSAANAADVPLAAGMVTSNEPGFYLEGQYGIRLENLVLCVAEAGEFLSFAPLTMIPFDRDAIAVELLSPEALHQLNNYHATVRAALAPYLDAEEMRWLEAATAPLVPNA